MPGGSGRGNAGKAVIEDESRPNCPRCDGFMKSSGPNKWRCTDKTCGRTIVKNKKRETLQQRDEGANNYGYDIAAAEARADYIRQKYNAGVTNFVVVSAQNNTRVFAGFWQSLKTYCKKNKAELIVIASHYKNMDAWNKGDAKDWAKEIQPFIVHGDLELGEIIIKASFKINATTLHPLNGKQAHGRGKWCIFGHPQQAMQPIATPGNMYPLRQYTTGSCTRENYSVSDLGEKARFNHVFGALIISFKGHKYPFIRQLSADGKGNFYDLDKRYTGNKVSAGHRIECLTPGDEHVKFNACETATYSGKKSIVKLLKPKRIFRHDILDGYSGSHHHEGDDVLQFKKFIKGDDDYRAELEEVVEFINRTTPKGVTSYIVPSNHDEHLTKWLRRADYRKDHKNAQLILELQQILRQNAIAGKTADAMQIYLEPRLNCKYKFLNRNEAFLIDNVDHSQHGDVGVNGSRGSARALANTAFKMTIGHSHGARIDKGVYQAGTSTGKLEYEKGLGDHSITHVIQYPGGKRTHIDIYGDDWH